jgi:hypothetical protein
MTRHHQEKPSALARVGVSVIVRDPVKTAIDADKEPAANIKIA